MAALTRPSRTTPEACSEVAAASSVETPASVGEVNGLIAMTGGKSVRCDYWSYKQCQPKLRYRRSWLVH
ncbi:MAG: hypothetical protein PVS2B1_20300 [Candidatus Dormibacteraceae bacterium]